MIHMSPPPFEHAPFKHAILTLGLLENHIKHMNIKWQLYNSIGYLPATNAFEIMVENIEMCKTQIRSAETYIKTNKFESLTDLATLRETLYYNIENISDIMNAFNYGFLNRLTGLVASDPIVGMEVASKQFGGVQLIHNATESLMKDYVECQENYLFNINLNYKDDLNKQIVSKQLKDKFARFEIPLSENAKISNKDEAPDGWMINDERKTYNICKDDDEEMKVYEHIEYRGIVVFGFKNRAITYPQLIVHFPSYAEHDLEYLIILAHEAYHLNHSGTSGISAFKLKEIQNNIEKILRKESLTSLYLPETLKDKNTPNEVIAEVLADDIMADIYATIVAGEAYPKILGKYYLPIMLDTKGSTNPAYSSLVIGSLKMRIAALALEMMNWESPVIEKIKQDTREKIKYWESLSKRIALTKLDQNELCEIGLLNIENKLDSICEHIKKENAPGKMLELIKRPYHPKKIDERRQFETKLEEVRDILIEEPEPKDIARIWEKDLITPRNLISLLALNSKIINRNALLIAIGYHKNILERF